MGRWKETQKRANHLLFQENAYELNASLLLASYWLEHSHVATWLTQL